MCTNYPILSIIVPVYNVAEYVINCLNSIDSQTFHNYECIIVDDASIDRTGEICEQFAATHKKFILIRNTSNQGLSVARNIGIKKAKGMYIGFVDGDDWIHPDMYRVLVEQLQNTKADFVSCMYDRAISTNEAFAEQPVLNRVELNRQQMFKQWFGYYHQKKTIRFEYVWNKLYTREIIGDILFVPNLVPEDKDFNFRVLLRCKKGVFINQSLYKYLIRKDSISYIDDIDLSREWVKKSTGVMMRFFDHIDELNDEEKGFLLSTLFRKAVSAKNMANLGKKDPEMWMSFKDWQNRIEPQFMSNKTISATKKIPLYLSAHVPILYKLMSKYYTFAYK